MRSGGSAERPAILFEDPEDFRAWLVEHHETATELWMGLHKKHVQPQGLTWAAAVREALCFGWIDSQSQRIDEDSVRQRWTPRRPNSIWSQINIDAVEEMTKAGRMLPAGLAAYAKRKPERSGVYAYENRTLELPVEYAERLAADAVASAFWAAATPGYRKIAVNWVVTAKQEATRERRMAQLIADCGAGQLIPSQRYGDEPGWLKRARAAADAVP